VIGLAAGWWVSAVKRGAPVKGLAEGPLANFARGGVGFDAAYRTVAVGGAEGAAEGVTVLDRDLLDRGLLGLGSAMTFFGGLVARFQTGFVRNYALVMFAGAAILLLVVAWLGVRA